MRVARTLREMMAANCDCGGLALPAYNGFLRKGSAKDHSGAAFSAPAKINSDTPARMYDGTLDRTRGKQ